MKLLISETTREEREAIVAEALGNVAGFCDECARGMEDLYDDYIEGKKELREINEAFRRGMIKGVPDELESVACIGQIDID